MPKPLTDAYLKEIQARIAAASKGPWPVHLNDFGHPDGFGPFSQVEHPDADMDQVVADIEFAAHAREDVRNLYGEIARLKAELADRDRAVLREAANELELRTSAAPDGRIGRDAVLRFLREYGTGRVSAR